MLNLRTHGGTCDFCTTYDDRPGHATFVNRDNSGRDICVDCVKKAAALFKLNIDGEGRRPSTIMSLSHLFKRALDKDYRKMAKAGFIDKEGELTDEGVDLVNALFIEVNKAAIVAAAEERIQELKDEKDCA